VNIHHLELFYYVAKYGGISDAVRNIPYGIQQPAVSGQIIRLEEFLGATLFTRRPFALTPVGEELYDFIKPFFGDLGRVTEKLCGGASQQLRIGASETVLHDHLPAILFNVRKQFPGLKLSLRQGYQPQLESWLQNQEIDLAVTLLEDKTPRGITAMTLLKLPLILLVEKKSRLTSAQELWKRDKIEETLISLPASEPISRYFQRELNGLGVDWFPSIEVSSLDLIETYVANGFGIGLSIAIPNARLLENVRAMPLDEFVPVILGVLWQGKLTPVMKAFLSAVQQRAKRFAN
jgi:DNA-binding transcriptional LysR family regulator